MWQRSAGTGARVQVEVATDPGPQVVGLAVFGGVLAKPWSGEFHYFFDVGNRPDAVEDAGDPEVCGRESAAELPRFADDQFHGPGGSEFNEIGSHRPGSVPAKNFRLKIPLRFARARCCGYSGNAAPMSDSSQSTPAETTSSPVASSCARNNRDEAIATS